jgi:acetyltransferase
MTIRNLQYLFKPASMALIGAGQASETLMIRNLVNAGFAGPVMPVHPTRPAVEGILAYPDIASLPRSPDLAVIMSPLRQTPEAIGQLGARGTRAAVIISTSNSVPSPERANLQQAILDAAKPYLLRVLGPDCLGLSVPAAGLNATLSQYRPPAAGHLAFVTHASAIARAALDWGTHLGVGFSHLISLGEAIDVDFADILDFLAEDAGSRAILLYLEQIRNPRKFLSAARRAARVKPVIALKPRRYTEDGAGDAVYEAAFRRAGILRVSDRHELFNLVETLLAAQSVRHDRLAVLTNSSSLGLLAVDTLYHYGGQPARFSESTARALEALLKTAGTVANPVDLGDQTGAEVYGKALDVLLNDSEVDGILVINSPSALHDALPVAEEIVKRLSRCRICLLASFIGPLAGQAARRRTMEHQIPTYETSDEAVRAFMRLVQHKRNQELLMETPPSVPEAFVPDVETARRIIAQVLAFGRNRLYEPEAMQLLTAYGIPVVNFHRAADPAEAADVAARLGRSVALKIMSSHIANKTQVDAVMRYLESPAVVREAAEAMLTRLRKSAPEADIQGFLIQPIEYRGGAYDITVGVRPGGPFGPVIYFGQGGSEAEVIDDIAYGLPPLNMNLAREMMAKTRIYPVLRDNPLRAVDLDALALTLIKISQMVIDLGGIVELEINPLRASAHGVLALDARARVAAYTGDPPNRLAIRPYPKQLEQGFTLPDGRRFLLRPILPEDEPALQALVRRMPPEDVRMRFFHTIKELPHPMAARLTQIDYDREMAFVVADPVAPGKAEISGVVRAHADPDNDKAEYAILVDRSMAGLGLGPMLMRRIIDYCRERGTRQLVGDVLRENEAMLKICEALGFAIEPKAGDPDVRYVVLRLQG